MLAGHRTAGSANAIGVVACPDRFGFMQTNVQCPEKPLLFQVKGKDTVMAGGGQVQVVVELKISWQCFR